MLSNFSCPYQITYPSNTFYTSYLFVSIVVNHVQHKSLFELICPFFKFFNFYLVADPHSVDIFLLLTILYPHQSQHRGRWRIRRGIWKMREYYAYQIQPLMCILIFISTLAATSFLLNYYYYHVSIFFSHTILNINPMSQSHAINADHAFPTINLRI